MDGSQADEELYAFGPFRVDPSRRRLTRGAEALTLTPTVFDVLLHLVARPGRVVTKDELLDAVWQGRTVEESNVKQAVFTLRRILGPEGPQTIVTAPGRGYRFAAPVWREPRNDAIEPLSPPADPFQQTPAVAEPTAFDAPKRRRWPLFAAPAILLVALSGWWIWSRTRPPAPVGRTVVLADFDNRTGDAVFDRSLANLLRVDLGQSPFLTVVSERQSQATLALMKKPGDSPVTPPLAAEICARNNGDATIQGGVAAFGARYLLTLTASDCASGQTLAAEKAEVAGREAVISAMDALIARLRARLGEPRRSIRRFDVPLLPEKTASLDALKVYSDAKWLFDRGHIAEAIPLAVHATELDPTFPAAYTLLGVSYASLNDMTKSEAALDRAYALRPLMSERGRLQVEALRAQLVTHDYDAAIRAMRLQTAIYPREPVAWANLANAEDFVGQSTRAIADGLRALALQPAGESAYVVLMRAQRHDGRLADAERTGELALRRGFDSDAVHRELLAIAAARGDAAGIEREEAWGRSTDAPKVWEMQAELALGQGRVRQAEAIYDRLGRLLVARGSDDWGRPVEARLLATLGYGLSAIGPLKQPTTGGESDRDYLWTLARVGDGAKAERTIAAMLRAKPDDTLLHAVYAPEIRASLAIRRGDGAAAVRDLAHALPYTNRDLDVQDLLGNAYLAAGDGARAAAAFRVNLAHRYWSPDSPLYPLAKLGLARALKLEGDEAGAIQTYEAFLSDWRGADPDVPVLEAAKAEYRRLAQTR